jgi:hypothetical protein
MYVYARTRICMYTYRLFQNITTFSCAFVLFLACAPLRARDYNSKKSGNTKSNVTVVNFVLPSLLTLFTVQIFAVW